MSGKNAQAQRSRAPKRKSREEIQELNSTTGKVQEAEQAGELWCFRRCPGSSRCGASHVMENLQKFHRKRGQRRSSGRDMRRVAKKAALREPRAGGRRNKLARAMLATQVRVREYGNRAVKTASCSIAHVRLGSTFDASFAFLPIRPPEETEILGGPARSRREVCHKCSIFAATSGSGCMHYTSPTIHHSP